MELEVDTMTMGNTHQLSSKHSSTLCAWIFRAINLCSGSNVDPNLLADHISDAHISPRRPLILSNTGDLSRSCMFPMRSNKNSPHFNLEGNNHRHII